MEFFKVIHLLINVWRDRRSDFTGTYEMKKKFSAAQEYVRSKAFLGKSGAGMVKTDTHIGNTWEYEYDAAGDSGSDASRWIVTIQHYEEAITLMEVRLHSNLPQYELDKAIEKMRKALPDYVSEVKEIPEEEKEDYSKLSYSELLDKFDKAACIFGDNPNASNFIPLHEIRKALGNLIDAKPLADRGKFANAMKNIDLYLSSIKTQLSNPMTAGLIRQFVDNYVSQIRSSVSELAGLSE